MGHSSVGNSSKKKHKKQQNVNLQQSDSKSVKTSKKGWLLSLNYLCYEKNSIFCSKNLQYLNYFNVIHYCIINFLQVKVGRSKKGEEHQSKVRRHRKILLHCENILAPYFYAWHCCRSHSSLFLFLLYLCFINFQPNLNCTNIILVWVCLWVKISICEGDENYHIWVGKMRERNAREPQLSICAGILVK